MLTSVYNVLLLLAGMDILAQPFAGTVQINGTVGGSVILPCHILPNLTSDLRRIRFHWQDERDKVLCSFNKGKTRPEYVSPQYFNRTNIFNEEEIRSGNLSVQLNNVTFEDNNKVAHTFFSLLDNNGSGVDDSHKKLCETTLFVAVPFQKPKLTMNYTTMSVTCSTQGGFPSPKVTWTYQNLSGIPDAQTTIKEDDETKMYHVSTEVNVRDDQRVTCSITNPTSNNTVSDSITPSPQTPGAGTICGIVLMVLVLVLVSTCVICGLQYKPCGWCGASAGDGVGPGDGARGDDGDVPCMIVVN